MLVVQMDGMRNENSALRALVDGLGKEKSEFRPHLAELKHRMEHENAKFVRKTN